MSPEPSFEPSPVDGQRPVRHRFDPGSLLAAALFGALGTAGLLDRTVSLGRELRWVWPMLFLGVGAALLVSAASRPKNPPPPDSAPTTTTTSDSWDNGSVLG